MAAPHTAKRDDNRMAAECCKHVRDNQGFVELAENAQDRKTNAGTRNGLLYPEVIVDHDQKDEKGPWLRISVYWVVP